MAIETNMSKSYDRMK